MEKSKNHEKKIITVKKKFTFLKATSHSTIFDIPMRRLREDQKYRHRIIPLNFDRCTLPRHRNRQVKGDLKEVRP